MIKRDKDGLPIDTLAILYMDNWLYVLAAPREYSMLQRTAEPEVILKLLDVWIGHGERMARGEEEDLYGHRFDVLLARKLRALIAAWTPPELPNEIVEAARAILQTEGQEEPQKGVRWDDYAGDQRDGRPLESLLVWSEQIDEVVNRKEATPAEVKRAERRWTRLLRRLLPKDLTIAPDFLAIVAMKSWLEALASPHLYRSLDRPVEPEVLLKLVDVWIAHGEGAAREGDEQESKTYNAGLARKLRVLITAWRPPGLPAEISEAARSMLHAWGLPKAPDGGPWADYTPDHPQWQRVKSDLVWSERVDAILPK